MILPFSRRQLPAGLLFAGDVVGPNSWRFDQTFIETADSSRTFFTLAENYQDDKIIVFNNGIKQVKVQNVIFHPPNVVEFTVAPVTGAKLECWYLVPDVAETSIWSVDEPLSGAKNGSNLLFTTKFPYVAGKLLFFRNGAKQIKGVSAQYLEVNSTTIQCVVAPTPTDFLEAAYMLQV